MTHNKRVLYSSLCKCKFGCHYCFAKIDSYLSKKRLPAFSSKTIKNDRIIYPSCDSEFFSDTLAMSNLEDIVQSTQQPIQVSISIKSPIDIKQVKYLKSLNDCLASNKFGFIKCSVSITTKYNIKKYEPNTSEYSERIHALKLFADMEIPTSVNLKPILPFISVDEYHEIIQDTLDYTKSYLIGGLYIDINSEFGKMINTHYPSLVSIRPVDWLPGRPLWQYCEDPVQLEYVRQIIITSNRMVFDTDIDLMNWMSSEIYQMTETLSCGNTDSKIIASSIGCLFSEDNAVSAIL